MGKHKFLTGGGTAVLVVSSFVYFNYYSRMEQSGSLSGSCSEGRELKSHSCNLPIFRKNLKRKKGLIIKQISKQDIEKLLKANIIKNTNHGYVDANGEEVGFYRTKGVAGKRYIQDRYADMVANIK